MIDPVDKIRAIIFAAGILTGLAVASVVLSGCTAPRGPLVVTDPDPSVKIPAIKKAATHKDRKAVRQLVAELSSDDPAVRFYAISGLQRITGERLGYDYFASDERREAAVKRWQQWLQGRPPAPAGPATAGPATADKPATAPAPAPRPEEGTAGPGSTGPGGPENPGGEVSADAGSENQAVLKPGD